MFSSKPEPLREVSEKQLAILLSNMKTTLSRILYSLRNDAASDGSIFRIYSGLKNISIELDSVAERLFPASSNLQMTGSAAETLRQIDPNFRHQLTYCSPKMHALIDNIECAARRDIPVLITGETGVGKELIARFIHVSSKRKRGPLIPINCAAITRDLFEDQFFGHKQGAFTGALRDYQGVIRSASGGTLFLDEVGEIPLDLQPKLLRFLQEGEVHTVGENLPVRVDVRVVASTNRDLKAEVKQGRFRADLLHRLNVISFEIPPLRDRPEDIPLLLNFFIRKYSCLPENHKVQFAPDAVDCLTKYSWPGNVRELSNLVLRIISLAEEEHMIFLSDLPVEITSCTGIVIPEDQPPDLSTTPVEYVAKSQSNLTLGEAVARLERQKVYDALLNNNWSYSRAARQLGLSTYGLRKKYHRLFGKEPISSASEE